MKQAGLLGLLTFCACHSLPSPSDPARTAGLGWLVVEGATVISDPKRSPPLEARIVIRDDRIACIGSGSACPFPTGARRIDGRGRWVIPGLFDAHVHISEERGDFGPLYLAYGITSVRDVGGYPDSLAILQSRFAEAKEPGPRVYYAGHPIDGDPPLWPKDYPEVPRVVHDAGEAEAAVLAAQAEGAAFIKLYNGLTTELVRAAAAKAHSIGLKVTGDVIILNPDSMLAADIDGFEHAVPPLTQTDSRPRWDWTLDSSGMDRVLSKMQASDVALASTLVFYERLIGGELPTSAPTFRTLPKPLQDRSAEFFAKLPQSDSSAARRRRIFDYICRTIRLFNEKDGLMLAGTDSYFLGSYPGDLHRELELQVACGLTPAQALAAGTRNPAAWLAADSIGTLNVGRLADMIILGSDPLADIRNTSDIVFVIKAGQIHTPAQIRAP